MTLSDIFNYIYTIINLLSRSKWTYSGPTVPRACGSSEFGKIDLIKNNIIPCDILMIFLLARVTENVIRHIGQCRAFSCSQTSSRIATEESIDFKWRVCQSYLPGKMAWDTRRYADIHKNEYLKHFRLRRLSAISCGSMCPMCGCRWVTKEFMA